VHVDHGPDPRRLEGGQQPGKTVVIPEEIVGVLDDEQLDLFLASGRRDAIHIVVLPPVAGNAFVGFGLHGVRADFREHEVAVGSRSAHSANQGIRVVGEPGR